MTTDAEGKAKAAKKYLAGTKFEVTVSKEGYELVTDVTKGITVDPRQSANTYSYVMNIKSVSLIPSLSEFQSFINSFIL